MEPPQKSARDLAEALGAMAFHLEPGRFALVGFPGAPGPGELAALGTGPAQLVVEPGETTLLVGADALPCVLARHPAARVERDLRWIRFEAPMGWEVVGFLAHVSAALAAAGVPIGAVCGFSRDHLFVAERHLERALAVLRGLFPERP